MKKNTKKCLNVFAKGLFVFFTSIQGVNSQITLKQDYTHNDPADIGTFQGINFKEGGFSALYPILGTNGKEFWTISDRGVNIDAANANLAGCRPTYDKIYSFPNYVPKIHRIRIVGSSIKVLQTITMKRPDGSGASGIINPTGFGSTALEVASTDTVLDCNNFNLKTTAKDVWGIDSEGLVVDAEGNFWIAEEGGPTIWKLNKNGVVVKRYTPYANLVGAEPQDVAIDTVFKYRKNNRGFEGLSITPNGKIYAIIQSPVLYPSKAIGEGSRIHRILEINPLTNETRMFAYLNDGIIGASGSNQIRLRDWKIGDMAAINNDEFLVIEQALRGTTDRKFIYKINISNATNVNSGLYSGVTLEALVDQTGLTNNSITPVQKTLFMDLLANNWPSNLEKAEGLAIINDSTFALVNDNDFGQYSPAENGLAVSNGILSHLFTYGLSGSNKLTNYVAPNFPNIYGEVAMSTLNTPYLQPSIADAKYTSILTAGDDVNGYKLAGLGDGLGAYDNNDGTFSLLMNHEMSGTEGITRAHGQKGAFVSKWIINKNDLSVVSGSDLIQTTKLWNGTSYATYNNSTPAPTAFSRFCAADLPIVSAFYNAKTGLGTQNRIFMNGEESGNEGRAFAHIATGTEAGTTYELPRLGKFSWENAIACPSSEDKTVVIGLDDATPGQVYVYVGTKTNTGNDVEKAGLTNGNLYGIAVNGLTAETSVSVPTANTTFTLANLGNVEALTGATIQTNSVNAGVTAFLRPEDGAWDPSHPEDFYFATTNSFTSPSRLWKLHFTDVKNPELGGTITAVLDGTEGQKMLDNLTIDNSGHILLQEDPGNQSYIAKMYSYNTTTDVLTTVGQHDETRFVSGGANFLTQDEESSGIIDVQEILGAGQFILYDQAHYAITGEVVQGGQLLAFYNPATATENPEIKIAGNSVEISNNDLTASVLDNTNFGSRSLNTTTTKSFTISNTGTSNLYIHKIDIEGTNAAEFNLANVTFPIVIAPSASSTISVNFIPTSIGAKSASLRVWNNDYNEYQYKYVVIGNGNEGLTALSSSDSPYMIPSTPNAKFTSILTAGDAVGGYKLAGLGDGLGAYDNNDGTFSLLINHEMSGTEGITRAHGQKGAFVSKWIINKSDLSVVSGSDLIQTTKLWNGTSYATYNNSTPAPTAFSRFCAADLPIVSAFYNAKTGLGSQNRIFMNGEESGNEGRAFAHIATGTEAGTTYELPRLGKFSWENAIACPSSEDKTVVIGLDDATPGQVYVYVGTKTNTGNDVEKAGLTNGNLYGIAVNGLTMETSSSVPTANTTFALANLGNVENQDGFSIQINSVNAGVTAFLRPEDGAWDPSHPEDFYFATTNSFTSPSRLWKLHFTDVKNPELGGTITAVLDGTEGQKMLDNLTIDNSGHILLQEDPGNQSYVAKMYEYNTATDVLTTIAQHDESRFVTGGANFLTQDEESSGIIDVQEILGAGQFILYDQAHYAITGEVVQGGQLLAFYNPSTADSLTSIVQNPSAVTICEDENTTLSISAEHATHYQWQVLNGATYADLVNNAMYSDVTTNTLSINNADLSLNGKVYRCIAGRLTGLKDTSATASISINQKTVPTFATINAFCEGTVAPVLATTSINSIDGLWQPATINNTSSATYTFTPNSNECAAEININVVVKPKTYSTTAQTICASELPYAWNGLVITSAGTYTKNLNGINTCDSIATLNLAVNTLDLTTSYSAGVLSANATNASYTWINCATNTPVSGQTSQTFSPTVNGNYAVIVNANNCSDTSACFNVSDLSVNDIHSALNNVSVYPNPTNNLVNVKIVSNENSTVAIELVDALGKLVQNTKNHDVMIGENLFEMNTQELNDGVYFISILSGNNSSKIKLIVKH